MKKLLVVIVPRVEKHLSDCNTIAKEVEAKNIPLQRPLENTFLLSGPKSFEGAMLIRDICYNNSLLYGIFEIEDVLFPPNEGKDQKV